LNERRSFLTAACSTGLALVLLGCGSLGSGPRGAADESHPLIGAAAPAFELPAAIGKGKVDLASHAGKVVVVDFWATWCNPCRESFPAYQRLSQKLGSDVVVIGVSVDDEPSAIPKFAKETGVRFPLAWDDGQATSKTYQPPTMPTAFVIDRTGVVRYVHSGFHAGDEAALETEIDSLLR
jgi:peroxiredoxin